MERADATREMILATAERLFAERRVPAFAHRQGGEPLTHGAADHRFGSKADLVRAIVRTHGEHIERIRGRMLAEMGDSGDVRDWVACLVQPVTEHLTALGSPSWYARFCAQLMIDPALRGIADQESHPSPALHRILEGLRRCRMDLPAEVYAERVGMALQLIVHMCAERESSSAENMPSSRPSWHDTSTGLIDAIVGLWLAPVSNRF
ncbi:TetR/AcrR family transcriptional regulator [Streptomyces shenzhenensis]